MHSFKKFLLFTMALLFCQASMGTTTRSVENINRAWKYKAGDFKEAEKQSFNDSDWEKIGLPHSFSIPYFRNTEFYVGYGWYRKMIAYQSAWENKRVHLDFEGVFQVAEIYLNEKWVGKHEGGYNGFTFDITNYLQEGDNLIAIRVNNLWSATLAPRAGEHVFGGGIYRDVSIRTTSPVYVAWKGTFVTTPEVSKTSTKVKIITELVNTSTRTMNGLLRSIIKNKVGEKVAEIQSDITLQPQTTTSIEQLSNRIKNPELWSPQTPNLYTVETVIENKDTDKTICDQYTTSFGVRWLEWTKDKGFFINGKHCYLEGVNVHQDHAGWGDAITKAGIYRDIKMMKDAGFNFIRGSHYPHHPYFAEVCDQLGMFYISENVFWGIGGFGPDGYWNCSAYPTQVADEEPFALSLEASLQDMIRINRNSPSIIAWSMSNEAFFSPVELMPKVRTLMKRLVEASHRLDASRIAFVGGCQRGELDILGDAAGYNGDGATIYINPDVPNMVSEYGSCISDRPGNYEPCWGNIADNGAKPAWRTGHAIWCGFDHGSIAGDMGKMGLVDFFRIPKRGWYWYRNYHLGIAPPQWPQQGIAKSLKLSADKTVLQGTDGTDDALILVTVTDTNGTHLSNSPNVTLSIVSGPGEFPTGRSITFHQTTADNIRILDGQAAIEFRSYEGGKTIIQASSEGLETATIELTTQGSPTYVEGVTPVVKERIFRIDTIKNKVSPKSIRVVSDFRPTRSSGVQGKNLAVFANDNNESTCWQSDPTDKAAWWWLDMENFYKISEVSFNLGDSKCNFNLEISEDGKTWVNIAKGNSDDTKDGWCNLSCDTNIYAVYFRISFTPTVTGRSITIKEIKIKGENKE